MQYMVGSDLNFYLIRNLKAVLVGMKKVQSKLKALEFTALYIDFSDAQRQVTL